MMNEINELIPFMRLVVKKNKFFLFRLNFLLQQIWRTFDPSLLTGLRDTFEDAMARSAPSFVVCISWFFFQSDSASRVKTFSLRRSVQLILRSKSALLPHVLKSKLYLLFILYK
jgi:hypothetical protein